jgi:capsular exopolysaccharide synthesis family protein
LFIGCVLALVTDSRDSRIHSSAQLEQLLGTPLLATLPAFAQVRGWTKGLPQLSAGAEPAHQIESLDLDSGYAESLRGLRTSLLLSRSQRHPKVILIASAEPGEGKSTTALHLATILGQLKGRILIVDGDLRRPTLHRKLNIANDRGLSLLLSETDAETQMQTLAGPGDMWVLTAGPRPPYPAELLSSERMTTLLADWRTHFDFILIDTPPILSVTDAVLLSAKADIVLLVVRQGVSTAHAVRAAHHKLADHVEHNQVAIILNAVERRSGDLANYYGYQSPYGATPKQGRVHAS